MNPLQLMGSGRAATIDSREVAAMVGKEHNMLLRDIRVYCKYLGESSFAHSDFFMESSYQSEQNKTMPCYLVTRKGCEMIANKLTGEKGVLFTAAYINRFHELEGMTRIPQSFSEALRLAADLAEQNNALALENSRKDQLIGELKPKVEYVDWILTGPNSVITTAIAKDYGMSAAALNCWLRDRGVQYKRGGQWFLTRKYQDKGYTSSRTFGITRTDGRPDVRLQTRWTQKGRLFLYELLKSGGILPVMERDQRDQ